MQRAFIGRFIGWFLLANIIIFWLLGWPYLHSILSSETLLYNFIANYSHGFGKYILLTFTWVNYFTYMMFLASIPSCVIFFLGFFVPFLRFVVGLSVVCFSVAVVWLITDIQVYSMFKFHLNSTIFMLGWHKNWYNVFDFSRLEIFLFISAMIFVFFVESLIAWFICKKMLLFSFKKIGCIVFCTWFLGFLLSYIILLFSMSEKNNLFIQQGPNLPLFNAWIAYILPAPHALDLVTRFSEGHYIQAVYSHDKMNYPRHALQCHRPQKPLHVILIAIDSLRADSLDYMPHVKEFAQDQWQFLQHRSAGNSTQAGMFSLFYSLPSSYWTAVLEQKKTPLLMDLLREYGYVARVFWTANMHYPPLDQALFRGVQPLRIEGSPSLDLGDADRYTTSQAVDFIKHRPDNKPFFLSVFYDAPHGFCRKKSFPARFQPAFAECSRLSFSTTTDPMPLRGAYWNTVAFIDEEMTKILQVIKQEGLLNNSIIIITSDHGQEFNDNHKNYWGHAGNYTTAQTQVPLIIHWPGQERRRIEYMTSSYDLIPTLLLRLFQCSNAVSDYSIGYDLLQEKGRVPFILAGSYANMGLIEKDRLNVLYASGLIQVTDLHAKVLPNAHMRPAVLQQALHWMREYFL